MKFLLMISWWFSLLRTVIEARIGVRVGQAQGHAIHTLFWLVNHIVYRVSRITVRIGFTKVAAVLCDAATKTRCQGCSTVHPILKIEKRTYSRIWKKITRANEPTQYDTSTLCLFRRWQKKHKYCMLSLFLKFLLLDEFENTPALTSSNKLIHNGSRTSLSHAKPFLGGKPVVPRHAVSSNSS